MAFFYFILFLVLLIKWLLPTIIIVIVTTIIVIIYLNLKGQNKKSKSKSQDNVYKKITLESHPNNEINKQQNEKIQELFLDKEIESYNSDNSLLNAKDDKYIKTERTDTNSSAISQIISGLLNHAIQQENKVYHKKLLKSQIQSREQAHILHNNGQLEKEINYIKKEIENCNFDSPYYKYWEVLLNKRMIEYKEKENLNKHSLLISQIISDLLNHAIQQEKENTINNNVEDLRSSNTKTHKIIDNTTDLATDNKDKYLNNESSEDNVWNEKNTTNRVPYWEHTYVYSANYLQNANFEQKQFYKYFKKEFIRGNYIDIEGNYNYAFVLMFDLAEDYKKHKKYDLLKIQFDALADNYPLTAKYTSQTLSNAIIAVNQKNMENTLKTYDRSRGQLCQWITSKESIEVQGINLIRGNFYIGECFLLPKNIIKINHSIYSGYQNEYIFGSVLNPKLHINTKDDSQTSVFCSYYDMSPSKRYEYLIWLSGKKEAQEVSIDILMFYLYGCEIKVFIDPRTKNQERKEILDNISQLYISLNNNSSGRENAEPILLNISEFIGNAIVKYFHPQIENFNNKNILRKSNTYVYCLIQQNITDKSKCSAENAFDIACKLYNIEEIVPINYISIAKSYFISYFENNYNELCLNYNNSTLEEDICFQYNRYNNIAFCPENLKLYYKINSVPSGLWQIHNVISRCYEELEFNFRSYNLEKKYSSGKETIMAILFLPLELNLSKIPSIQAVISQIKSEMQANDHLTKHIEWILELFEFNHHNANKSIHINYVKSITTGIKRMGFGIVPNYEIDSKRFNFGDICVIYKNEENYPIERTQTYEITELFIKLASYILHMDQILTEDLEFLEKQVLSFGNTKGNQLHLNACIRWLLQIKKQPLNKKIKDSIALLIYGERILIANTLIKLACINGNVHPKRIDGLKKVLPLLGMEVDNIHSQIHRILTDSEGFATVEKKEDAVEFKISNETKNENQQSSSNIILNPEKLHTFEEETKNAQELLSKIFVDEDISIPQNSINNSSNEKWKDMLKLLLTRDAWKRDEIENRCKEEGLMLAAVLEQINDFSYNMVDDIVIDDDGEYLYVSLEYKEKLL